MPSFLVYLFYLKKLFKSLECEGALITDCTSCDTTNTHRDDNHVSGECPCSLGYTDAGIKFNLSLTCTPPNFNDYDSCDTFSTCRNDYSSINNTCPC